MLLISRFMPFYALLSAYFLLVAMIVPMIVADAAELIDIHATLSLRDGVARYAMSCQIADTRCVSICLDAITALRC